MEGIGLDFNNIERFIEGTALWYVSETKEYNHNAVLTDT